MGARSTTQFTTGLAGSGKSYRQCAFVLVNEWFRDPEAKGVHYSNFPVQFDAWTDGNGVQQPGLIALLAEKGIDEETVRRRVRVLPQSVDVEWQNIGVKEGQERGPWDYFSKEDDLSEWHIAIDECHHYCGQKSKPFVRARWQKWLGELRHAGATIEFLSQHEGKVANEIIQEAEVRYELVSSIHRRDVLFNVKFYDWYQLLAKFTGIYKPSFWRMEYRKVLKKWELQDSFPFWLHSELFGVYDSFSAPKDGGSKGTTGKHPYQKYSWFALVQWFLVENLFTFVPRSFGLLLLVVAFFNAHFLMGLYMDFMTGIGKQQAAAPKKEENKPSMVAEFQQTAVQLDNAQLTPQQLQQAYKAQAEAMAIEVERLEQERQAAVKERQDLANQLQQAFSVAALTKDQVTFRAGFSYSVGETIDLGPYQGTSIAKVDYARRLCVLSDGRSLRMGFGVQEQKPKTIEQEPQLHEPLRATSGARVATETNAARSASPISLNGGNADGGIRSVGKQPDRR